jgi:ABC-type uncharacterized transport system YnjBCD permease subunit
MKHLSRLCGDALLLGSGSWQWLNNSAGDLLNKTSNDSMLLALCLLLLVVQMLMCDERSERICHGFYRAFRVAGEERARETCGAKCLRGNWRENKI